MEAQMYSNLLEKCTSPLCGFKSFLFIWNNLVAKESIKSTISHQNYSSHSLLPCQDGIRAGGKRFLHGFGQACPSRLLPISILISHGGSLEWSLIWKEHACVLPSKQELCGINFAPIWAFFRLNNLCHTWNHGLKGTIKKYGFHPPLI